MSIVLPCTENCFSYDEYRDVQFLIIHATKRIFIFRGSGFRCPQIEDCKMTKLTTYIQSSELLEQCLDGRQIVCCLLTRRLELYMMLLYNIDLYIKYHSPLDTFH